MLRLLLRRITASSRLLLLAGDVSQSCLSNLIGRHILSLPAVKISEIFFPTDGFAA